MTPRRNPPDRRLAGLHPPTAGRRGDHRLLAKPLASQLLPAPRCTTPRNSARSPCCRPPCASSPPRSACTTAARGRCKTCCSTLQTTRPRPCLRGSSSIGAVPSRAGAPSRGGARSRADRHRPAASRPTVHRPLPRAQTGGADPHGGRRADTLRVSAGPKIGRLCGWLGLASFLPRAGRDNQRNSGFGSVRLGLPSIPAHAEQPPQQCVR
jgi:hypothetical protein